MVRFFFGAILGELLMAGGTAVAQLYVSVPTNGVLKGYTVQDKRGRTVCTDPFVQNDFRGLGSFITCSD